MNRLEKARSVLRNSSTKAEIKLWNYLKGKQLKGYDFHRQKPVNNYIVDFFCNNLMLAIEIDGYTHSFESVAEKDAIKAEKLNEIGISVLRFSDNDVMNNIEGVISHIEEFSREHENKHTPLSPLDRGEKHCKGKEDNSHLDRGERH